MFADITKPQRSSLSQSKTECVDESALIVLDETEFDPTSFETFAFLMSLQQESQQEDDCVLGKHGYTKKRVICDTLQGIMYHAEKNGVEYAIKRTSKELHLKHEAREDEDGMNLVVEEDIIKEAKILRYLTVTNKPIGGYIVKYIDFFESDTDYYLVMEYAGDMNLAEFTETAHSYMQQKKLSLKDYRKVVKFIAWQIAVTLSWLHDTMNVCHLDLCLENIMISGNPFIYRPDGSVTVNTSVSTKICDFGFAEMFDINESGFKCNKWSLRDSYNYQSPEVYDECTFNGIKADIWSFGCILFKMCTNRFLYKLPDSDQDIGFWQISHNQLAKCIISMDSKQFITGKLFKLFQCIFNCDESLRCSTQQVLKSLYFEWYYKRYETRIEKKWASQKQKNKKQKLYVPLYSINITV